jgi:hypothetical protein
MAALPGYEGPDHNGHTDHSIGRASRNREATDRISNPSSSSLVKPVDELVQRRLGLPDSLLC